MGCHTQRQTDREREKMREKERDSGTKGKGEEIISKVKSLAHPHINNVCGIYMYIYILFDGLQILLFSV